MAVFQGYETFLNLTLEADLLAEDGLVLADNVLFRGMVTAVGAEVSSPASARLRDIARKLHAFNLRFLGSLDDSRTEGLILEEDDGLAIIWRKSLT